MTDHYQYRHDVENKRVYRFPLQPQVTPQPAGKGRKVYHYVRMQIDIVRADNVLTFNQWKYPTSEYPNFTYDDRYTATDAADYFMRNYAPRGATISREEYEALVITYSIP